MQVSMLRGGMSEGDDREDDCIAYDDDHGWNEVDEDDDQAEDLSADGPTAQRIRAELAALTRLPDSCFIVAETGDSRGRGLFAAAPIEAGRFLFDYEGEILSEAQFQQRYPKGIETDYSVRLELADVASAYLDAADPLLSNVARYMNHDGASPNCVMWTITHPVPRCLLFTQIDVAAGEELVWDYGAEYWAGREDLA